jgi:hypothetical protein
MCLSGATRLPMPWAVVSVSKHYKNLTQCVGLVQCGPRHHLIENLFVLPMI